MEQFSYHWIQNRVAVRLIGKIHELVHDPYKDGTKVMNEDWDNLIVLDAAQYDLFEETIDTDIFDNYSTVTSIGSTSGQWLSRNFSDRTFGDTINVTANPHTSVEVPEQFFELIEVDQEPIADSEKDGEILAFHPETLCEAARTAHEEFPNKRMIVHFMQPHYPFITTPELVYGGCRKGVDGKLGITNKPAHVFEALANKKSVAIHFGRLTRKISNTDSITRLNWHEISVVKQYSLPTTRC